MLATGPFEKAKRYIENKTTGKEPQVKYNIGPCITISREAGAGSDLIAGKIVDYLMPKQKDPSIEWGVFDKNLIEKVLEDHNLPSVLKKFVEDEPKTLSNMLNELFGIHPPILKLIHKATETIFNLSSIGNVIIIGRGSNIITKALPNSFHVRLVAPVDFRIKNVREFYGNTKKEAEDFIRTEDLKRTKFVYDNFHIKADDPLQYHIIINAELFGIEGVAKLIGDSVMLKFPGFYK